jgi:adenine specific DNA methylase Mod
MDSQFLEVPLSETGSIYVHCDYRTSSYLKLILIDVFGSNDEFNRSEIIWKSAPGHSDSGHYGVTHNTIFYFSKGEKVSWNQLYETYDTEYVDSHYRLTDENGRLYRTDNLTASGLKGGGYDYEWNGIRKIWRCPISRMQELHNSGRIKYTRNGTAEYI